MRILTVLTLGLLLPVLTYAAGDSPAPSSEDHWIGSLGVLLAGGIYALERVLNSKLGSLAVQLLERLISRAGIKLDADKEEAIKAYVDSMVLALEEQYANKKIGEAANKGAALAGALIKKAQARFPNTLTDDRIQELIDAAVQKFGLGANASNL